ncbi:MAG: uroporphyrinogen decarboxylase family protein [Actinomycetota bacterium]|nr:uroporphyrinogen decarboxylase family protein [Actinomycetota bacterium]
MADLLRFRQLKWAGAREEASRVRSDSVYQFVEPGTLGYEVMPAEDYDWFLDDPTDYIIRRHWPRIAGALEPFRELPPIHSIISYYAGIPQFLPAFGTPEMAGAFEALVDAARATAAWSGGLQEFFGEMTELGYPLLTFGISIAPFDYFADFFRGTTGCMVDMYRCPDKLKEAIDRVTPWIIDWALTQARMGEALAKRVFIPIHKASGGFMSEEQHKEFFWPSLRRQLLALIDAGYTPYVYSEGIYTDRLETISDVPRGKVIYHIESDLFKAKEILGDTACLSGDVPGSILNFGTPEEVKDYTKKVIDVVAKDGGFFLDAELPLITSKPENVKAMVEFAREYGVY